MPFELDGPLAIGTRARHGLIPYVVEEYEPGRRLAFRFAPGFGLDGTHRFDAQPLGPDCTRLSHTLDCTVKPKMLMLWPIVRGYHDALLEDILDRAELAVTGRHVRSRRWPTWLRLANATEALVARRRGRLSPRTDHAPRERGAPVDRLAHLCGIAVPTVLVAIAGIHAAWALGWRWPGGSDRALAERVVSSSSIELPPEPITWAVALALLAAAAIVRTAGTGTPSPALRGAAWAVSAVFLVRGAIFIPMDLIVGLDDIYERLDLAIYSPLCLAIGAGAAVVARRGSSSARHGILHGEIPAAGASGSS